MDFFKKASETLESHPELMKKAQGFLAVHQKPAGTTGTPAPAPSSHEKPATTTSDATEAEKKGYRNVYASAQVLYQGIQDKVSGKADVDERKLAAAAEDVLKAAESSGLLGKDNKYGDYFKKAELYLHNYGSKTSTAAEHPQKKPAS